MAINTEYQCPDGDTRNPSGRAFEHASKMVEEARAFGSAISGQVDSLKEAIDLPGRVQRHPIGMVFAALGVGYVLGGGLFSPVTARILRVGVRLALVPLIKSQLSALAEGAGRPPGNPAG